ncbi:hypothetical protein Bbelb_197560 [Branchiostoma belcheri]|nr:hypothetical protein Bbelb_197560 [Branchiostoma belcheri]
MVAKYRPRWMGEVSQGMKTITPSFAPPEPTQPPTSIQCNFFSCGEGGRVCSTKATVTTRRTCFCVLSTCKNVGKRTASVRGEYRLRTESYGFGSTQTRRRTLSACNTFSTCGLRIYHTCVRVRATRVPRTAYERATYGLRESNFTILTCNCCTDSARSTSVPRTVLASSVLTPHFPVDLLNDHAEHTCTILGAPHVQRTRNAPYFYSI